ncbi:MAG: serine/threonine-protein kinase [Polyangiales bacterium]
MPEDSPIPARLADRYSVERLLGRGGTSRVLQVSDERSGRRLALKQVITTGRVHEDARACAMFRQEFHVLSQIVHPNVVAVGEYGFDAQQPFYTMELLTGTSLSELAPLPWRRVCTILLELCSPLSMLHARRYAHGDVSGRNVLVTSEGVTKLIDFGALTAIDQPNGTIAGTPPHMAPELVRGQSVDGRIDVYALGALAYWALAGRHAYHARTIAELPQAWKKNPPRLTQLGLDVPPALENLVLLLLSLDPEARPSQLAELVQRLCALLDTPSDGAAAVVRAQIATPKLVGREDVLGQCRRRLTAAAESGQGDVLCITGPRGSGRSRVLEACALEASLVGATLLRASCRGGSGRAFGLLAQLLASARIQDASALDELPQALRVLLQDVGTSEAELAAALAGTPEPELQRFWQRLCAHRSCVVAIDDLGHADVPSIQRLLALVETPKHLPLVLIVTLGADTRIDRDLGALLARGHNTRLQPLDAMETLQLLRSLFGEPPGLERLAAWVQHASAGVPRAVVDLAHHAVDAGVVRYLAGQFTIAEQVELARLPSGFEAAITQRVAALPDPARELFGLFALITPFGPLSTHDLLALLAAAGVDQARALDSLDRLRDARVLTLGADGYTLRSESQRRLAAQQLSAAETRAWHSRLAALYDQRGHAARMLTAYHHEHAGERAAAYAILLQLDGQLRGFDDPNIRLGGSPLGISLHRSMLAHALDSGAPRVHELHFRRVLLRIGAISDASLGSDAAPLIAQLHDDAGLDLWDRADPTQGDHARILWCLARAQERFANAPPGERLPPFEAVSQFAQSIAAMSAICVSTCDSALLTTLVDWMRPLRSVAPVLAFSLHRADATARMLACGGREIALWQTLLAAMRERPEGMPELVYVYTVGMLHFRLGRDLAMLGDDTFAVHAERLASHTRTLSQASSLRLLHALAHGSLEDASHLRRERAIAALASGHEDQLLASSHIAELTLLDACGDLLELQRFSAWFEARAAQFPAWQPFATLARAYGLVLCDQGDKAEPLLAAAAEAAPPLQHAAWFAVRALRAEAALQCGAFERASMFAGEVLETAASAAVDMRPDTRAARVWALARAELGDLPGALARLQPLLAAVEEADTRTIYAAQLYEARARVALLMSDRPTFEHYYARVQRIYGRGAHPALIAKLQRLRHAGERRAGTTDPAQAAVAASELFASIHTELDGLHREQRCEYLLSLLLRDGRASAGHLYAKSKATQDAGFVRVASENTPPSDAAFDARVNAFASKLFHSDEEATRSLTSAHADLSLARHIEGEREQYSVLALRSEDDRLCGLTLLRHDPGMTSLGCTPMLCTLVADVLERLS